MKFKTNHEVVVEALRELNQVKGIDDTSITDKAVGEVAALLKLDECVTEDDFRSIRNSVVMIYSAFKSMFYPNEKNFSALDEIQSRLSAITTVIDCYLFKAGYEV